MNILKIKENIEKYDLYLSGLKGYDVAFIMLKKEHQNRKEAIDDENKIFMEYWDIPNGIKISEFGVKEFLKKKGLIFNKENKINYIDTRGVPSHFFTLNNDKWTRLVIDEYIKYKTSEQL